MNPFFSFTPIYACVVWLLASATQISIVSADNPEMPDTNDEFARVILPFLKMHCIECHGPQKAQAEFRVDKNLESEFKDADVRSHWAEVVNVLNSHEMPPEEKPRPDPAEVALVVDWITQRIVHAEKSLRENSVVMRRLNRLEYKNTIRDLVGIDFDVSGFPEDPSASGFDNIGSSLALSPMQMELYLDAARRIVDTAIFDQVQPPTIKWRFQVDSGDSDSNRVKTDGQNPIVNGGNNPVENGFKIIHHDSWDKTLNVRDFAMKNAGLYTIRIRAASSIPSRDQVVESARELLEQRFQKQMKDNPKGERWHLKSQAEDIEHFQKDWMYRYGPARMKVTQTLAGQPRPVGELDIPSTLENPGIYEFEVPFTTQKAGVTIEYAYSVPSVLENFWLQKSEKFARPMLHVDWLEIEGPVYPQWPPKSHSLLLPQELNEGNEDAIIESLIGRFVRRAFRRPVSHAEVEPYLQIYQEARHRGTSPIHSFKNSIVAVLVSPNFLFMTESPKSNSSNSESDSLEVDSHQLATRLAYFLWSSPPDLELTKQANNGEILKATVLRDQVTRMLLDPKVDSLINNFADQWLGLRDVGANPPAMELYPHYDRHLETSMIEESRATFRTILAERRSILDFVDSDYVVINERLARFYQIENVRGDEFRVVPVQPHHHRGGVLTQAAMLTITSNGTRTSPVKRGTWILKNILGTDPGLPVANAGDIAPKVPGIDKATVRQRLQIHRELAQCARCHNKIDPLGLALENFDASGQYREQEGFGYKGRIQKNDPRIDATSKLPDGTAIDGPQELKSALRQKEDLFLNCLAEKLMTYALGRELTLADRPSINQIVIHVKKNQYRLDEMIHAIVQSKGFKTY